MASQNLNSVATATSITPASDYLIISKGGTAINKITAATALSNAFAGAAKNTSITATDQLMMATGGTTANRIDYNVLAKAIIENYASSSLAGKTQSVQDAFAALNSKPNFIDLSSYIYDAYPSIIQGSGDRMRLYVCGNIGLIVMHFKASAAITSGNIVIPDTIPAARNEMQSALSCMSSFGGFIQYSGRTFTIRTTASSGDYLNGELVFVIN